MKSDDLFYKLISARYQQAKRAEYLSDVRKAKATPFNDKLKPLKKQLSALLEERAELIEKIVNQQATAQDFARYQQIVGEIAQIQEKISKVSDEKKKVIKPVNFLVNKTRREVKNYDKIIAPLVVTQPELQVKAPVESAVKIAEEGRLDEAALLLQINVLGSAAKGGRRGQL